jgi:hypothetical protein
MWVPAAAPGARKGISSGATHSTTRGLNVSTWTKNGKSAPSGATQTDKQSAREHIGRIRASSPDTYRPTCHFHIFIFVFHFGFFFFFSFLFLLSPENSRCNCPQWVLVLPPPAAAGAGHPATGRRSSPAAAPAGALPPPPAGSCPARAPPPTAAPDPAGILFRRQSSSSCRTLEILLPPAVLSILLAVAADEVVLRVHPSAPAGSNEVGVGGLFSNSG